MDELEGVWDVERTSGMLPPLLGVRKRIFGKRGETRVGGLFGVPFEVRGLSLHYLGVFAGFVDELEASGDGFRGRATFRGREFGRFVMRRSGGAPLDPLDGCSEGAALGVTQHEDHEKSL